MRLENFAVPKMGTMMSGGEWANRLGLLASFFAWLGVNLSLFGPDQLTISWKISDNKSTLSNIDRIINRLSIIDMSTFHEVLDIIGVNKDDWEKFGEEWRKSGKDCPGQA